MDQKGFSIPKWCLPLVLAGLAARVLLVGLSWGTVDADVWLQYGHQLNELGLAELTRREALFNHPPLPTCWAAVSATLSQAIGIPFPWVFKIPMVLADCASCALVWRIAAQTWGARRGAMVAAGYAWCPAAILVSGFACNTDSIYAFLSLLAAHLMLRGRSFPAGLALGAAINVKLIPTTLLLPMLLLTRDRRQLAHLIAGLAIMALPFVWPLAAAPEHFLRNALRYGSVVDAWGVCAFLLPLSRSPEWSTAITPVVEKYWILGRVLMFAMITWISLVCRRRNVSPLHTLASAAAMFLIVAPGFGVHYMAFVLPLMFATRPLAGVCFGLLAGIIQGMTYAYGIDGSLPLRTDVMLHLRPIPARIGVAAWMVLIWFVVQTVRQRTQLSASNSKPILCPR